MNNGELVRAPLADDEDSCDFQLGAPEESAVAPKLHAVVQSPDTHAASPKELMMPSDVPIRAEQWDCTFHDVTELICEGRAS